MSSANREICLSLCILAMLAVPGAVHADLIYQYWDDFSSGKASLDSYRHSMLWSQERVPLSEPYLFYVEVNRNRGLAFMEYKGQPAELGYRFPPTSVPPHRTVKGAFTLDVSFPSTAEISQSPSGYLTYRTSPDGMAWSSPKYLDGGDHTIDVTSASGVVYVLFSGARAVIDNLSVSLYSSPVTIRVPDDCDTIQAAIDAAGNGDVIEVRPAVYTGPGNRDIEFRGKAITVRGAAGPQYTIIDCEGGHRGFYFHESEGPDSELSGFTIRSGRVLGSEVPPAPLRWDASPAHPIGGGIYCEFSGPTITDCIIRDCGAEIGGGIGGVGAEPMIMDCVIEECHAGGLGLAQSGGRGAAIGLIGNSDATIANCMIRNNAAYYNSRGAGLYFDGSAVVVTGCTIWGNFAPGDLQGGGAYCAGTAGDVTFRNCIFSRNSARQGAAILAEWALDMSLPSLVRYQRCRVSVINCTIAHNELSGPVMPSGSAAIVQSSAADFLLTNSILWHNTGQALTITDSVSRDPVTYSDVQGGYVGPGNMSADPLFAGIEAGREDYHLRSKEGRYDSYGRWVADQVHSPCIDAGDPLASVGEEPPPNGNRINMGAYGGTKQASNGPQHHIYHVNGSGGNNWNTGLTAERPFATIGKAIEVADSGDTILVWPGVYRENLIFQRKAITVQSAADAAVLTTPGGSINGRAVSFYHAESSRSVLTNFVIVGCPEAGVFCSGASPTLKNLTIVGNAVGVKAYEGSDPNIINCILWDNRDSDLFQCKARYSNVENDSVDLQAGNMQTDPCFADPQNGDYHLKSRGGRYVPSLETWVTDNVTSPCIDAGDPEEEPRGERMPNGGRVNMGAYGGTPYASKSG